MTGRLLESCIWQRRRRDGSAPPHLLKRALMRADAQGNMGTHMVANLSKYLHEQGCPALTVFTRTTSKLPPVSDSIAHASSLFELAKKCDIIITSLASDEVVKKVYGEMFEGAREKVEKEGRGTIFVESSTIYPTTAGAFFRADARGKS